MRKLVNPSGIDVLLPRLSWYSESLQRGSKTTAYNIIVSSSIKNLNVDNGDLWDSKKVISDRDMNIIYGDKNFSSGMDCFWKVKIWDDKDNEWDLKMPAKWSMGLLNKSDWKAEWIGLDKIFRAMIQALFCQS